MPVGRIILKSISQSKKLSGLKSHGARLLYTWLIPNLDKNGCFSGEADVIKGMIFTRLPDTDEEIELYLDDLERVGLIIRYKVNGDMFLNVPDFEDRQPNLNKDREGKTNIPLPTPDLIQSNSRLNHPKDKISKDKISKDKIIVEFENEFDSIWKKYHPDGKKNKDYAKKRFIALCKDGQLEEFKKGLEGYVTYLEFKKKKENFEQRVKYFSTFCTDYKEYVQYYGHKVEANL